MRCTSKQRIKRLLCLTGIASVFIASCATKSENAYNTVYAKFTTYRRDILSAGVLSVRIIDAPTNRILQHQNFVGEYVWYTEWSSYSGDERALSDKQKRMTQLQPQLPPPHQDLFIEFTKPIYSQVLTFVRSAYRNY